MKTTHEYMNDQIEVHYLGHGAYSYYVVGLDLDFETYEDACAAIEGMQTTPGEVIR